MLFREVENKIKDHDTQLEQNKNVETIIVGTKIMETGQGFDNSTIIQSYINKLIKGEKLTLPKGNYLCNSPLDFTRLPDSVEINFQGNLYFQNNTNGVLISGEDLKVYFNGILSKYATYKDIPSDISIIGATLISTVKCDIVFNKINGFKKCINCIGDGTGNYEFKGMIYTTLATNYLNGTIAMEVNKNYGYVNENVFYNKWIDAYDGIKFINNDTWSDPFNNNRFMFTGFEQVEHDSFSLDGCRQTVVFSPRFEIIGNLAIDEKEGCSGNMFIIDYPLKKSQVSLKGLRRVWIGNLGGEDFEPIAQLQLSNWNKSPVNINRGYHKDIENDTIFFDYSEATGITFDKIFCKVKKSDGTIGNVYFDDFTTNGTLDVTNRNATLNRDIKIVKVSSTTTECVLTSNLEMQQNGYSFYLICKYKTKPIKINKASGSTVISDLPSVGTYQIMYISDNWKALKISDDVDSWYF